jgi:hypothetical protein
MKKGMRIKVVLTSLLLVALATLMTGCATLLANKHLQVRISSTPAGARVYVNGDFVGVTPVKLSLKNDNQFYTIEFRKDGYQPGTYRLGKHIGGGWFVLDMLVGAFTLQINDAPQNVCLLIDNISGSWYALDTDDVDLLLLQ